MTNNLQSLTGRVAIVTGGATGIGAAIARVLASRGARVAIVQPDGTSNASTFIADISDYAAVQRTIEAVVDQFGRIDILVNNAALTGAPAVAAFLDCSKEQLDRIVDVNLKGTYYCSQSVARHMCASKTPGSIVHIASVGAYAAQEMASAYCATKAALVSLAQTMSIELAQHGIRVNAVAPGDILTPERAAIPDDLNQKRGSGRFVRTTPLNRRGSPDDIARAVAFLASDEASFITGTTLTVDGGFLAY